MREIHWAGFNFDEPGAPTRLFGDAIRSQPAFPERPNQIEDLGRYRLEFYTINAKRWIYISRDNICIGLGMAASSESDARMKLPDAMVFLSNHRGPGYRADVWKLALPTNDGLQPAPLPPAA